MQPPLIISRHQGVVDWLSQRGITGEVVAHASIENVKGRQVIGVLPIYLASYAESIICIDLPDLPASLRGQELSVQQMDDAGATLSRYRVERLPL